MKGAPLLNKTNYVRQDIDCQGEYQLRVLVMYVKFTECMAG